MKKQIEPIIGYKRAFMALDYQQGLRPHFTFFDNETPGQSFETSGFPTHPNGLYLTKDPMKASRNPGDGNVLVEVAASGRVEDDGIYYVTRAARVLQILLDSCSVEECTMGSSAIERSARQKFPKLFCQHHSTAANSYTLTPYIHRIFSDIKGNALTAGYRRRKNVVVNNTEFEVGNFTPTTNQY